MGSETRQSLVESVVASPIAFVVTNPRRPDNPIEIANAAFLELTGYSEGEVLGRNCRLLAGAESEPWATEQLRQAVHECRATVVEILNYKKDGTRFRNGVMVSPLFDDAGKIAYFLGSQVDLGKGPSMLLPGRRAESAARVQTLSTRQKEVLAGVSAGLLNKQIAHQLGIAEKTVKMHRSLLLERLGVGTTAEAIRIAVEAGL
jgi:PAS domain S-box-containing protein